MSSRRIATAQNMLYKDSHASLMNQNSFAKWDQDDQGPRLASVGERKASAEGA